jgi:hypothetical protein
MSTDFMFDIGGQIRGAPGGEKFDDLFRDLVTGFDGDRTEGDVKFMETGLKVEKIAEDEVDSPRGAVVRSIVSRGEDVEDDEMFGLVLCQLGRDGQCPIIGQPQIAHAHPPDYDPSAFLVLSFLLLIIVFVFRLGVV